jgi:hypothetical protein
MTKPRTKGKKGIFSLPTRPINIVLVVLLLLAVAAVLLYLSKSKSDRYFNYFGKHLFVTEIEEVRSNTNGDFSDDIRLVFTGRFVGTEKYARVETRFSPKEYAKFVAEFRRCRSSIIQIIGEERNLPRRVPYTNEGVHPVSAQHGEISLNGKPVEALLIEAHPDFIQPVSVTKTHVRGGSYIEREIDLN